MTMREWIIPLVLIICAIIGFLGTRRTDELKQLGSASKKVLLFTITLIVAVGVLGTVLRGGPPPSPPDPLVPLIKGDRAFFKNGIEKSNKPEFSLENFSFEHIKRVYFVTGQDIFGVEKSKGEVRRPEAGIRHYDFPVVVQTETGSENHYVNYFDVSTKQSMKERDIYDERVLGLKKGTLRTSKLRVPKKFNFLMVTKTLNTMKCRGVLDWVSIAHNRYKGGYGNSNILIFFDVPLDAYGIYVATLSDAKLQFQKLEDVKFEVFRAEELVRRRIDALKIIEDIEETKPIFEEVSKKNWVEAYYVMFPPETTKMLGFHFVRTESEV